MATFLVVFVHSYNLLGYADYVAYNPLLQFCQMLAATAVLILFAISGYLLFRKDFQWAENMKKKCRTLALPFLVWNVFWLLFEIFGQHVTPQ